MKKYILLLPCLFLCVICSAQSTEANQLLQQLKSATDSTTKAETLNLLSIHYRYADPDKAIKYGEKAAELATKTKDTLALGKAYNNLGATIFMLGKKEEAAQYHYKALKLLEPVGDTAGLVQSYIGIGNIHLKQGDTDIANDSSRVKAAYKKALTYYRKALTLASAIQEKKATAKVFNNIANVHLLSQQLDSALHYQHLSLKLKEEQKDKGAVLISLHNIGMTYKSKGDYATALKYFRRVLNLDKEGSDKVGKALALRGIAEAYKELKQYPEALKAAEESLTLTYELADTQSALDISSLISRLYAATGNYEKAYQYLELRNQYQDSLYTQEQEKQLAELHTMYETEKKEEENKRLLAEQELQEKQLEQKTLIQYAIGLHLLLMTVLAIIFYSSRQRVKRVNQQLFDSNLQILKQKEDIMRQKEEQPHRQEFGNVG